MRVNIKYFVQNRPKLLLLFLMPPIRFFGTDLCKPLLISLRQYFIETIIIKMAQNVKLQLNILHCVKISW